MRLGGCMNWRRSLQKLTRRGLVFLEKPQKATLVSLAALVVSLGAGPLSLAGPLVSLAGLVASLGAALVSLAALRASLVMYLEEKENNGPRLILPPGAGLRDMLHVIYPPKTAERVFDPTIADMRLEWEEAMLHDQKWLAHWVRVRGLLTVLLTVLAHAVTALSSILKLVR